MVAFLHHRFKQLNMPMNLLTYTFLLISVMVILPTQIFFTMGKLTVDGKLWITSCNFFNVKVKKVHSFINFIVTGKLDS